MGGHCQWLLGLWPVARDCRLTGRDKGREREGEGEGGRERRASLGRQCERGNRPTWPGNASESSKRLQGPSRRVASFGAEEGQGGRNRESWREGSETGALRAPLRCTWVPRSLQAQEAPVTETHDGRGILRACTLSSLCTAGETNHGSEIDNGIHPLPYSSSCQINHCWPCTNAELCPAEAATVQ